MNGPTLPVSAEMKLNNAPSPANARAVGRHTGAPGRRRHRTMSRRKAPITRLRAPSGAVANSTPPASASGTAPKANQPTTGRATSRRLNHTRLPFPMSCATVRIGMASRTPNTATSAGRSTAAPPNPATAASVLARNAAPPSSSHCVTFSPLPPSTAHGRPAFSFPPGDGVRLEPPHFSWADDSYLNPRGRSLFTYDRLHHARRHPRHPGALFPPGHPADPTRHVPNRYAGHQHRRLVPARLHHPIRHRVHGDLPGAARRPHDRVLRRVHDDEHVQLREHPPAGRR